MIPSTFPFELKLGDWGSAVCWGDDCPALYGEYGPSADEETDGYKPPEALFGGSQVTNFIRLPSYDMWGVGVILLQIAIGSKDIWTIVDERKKSKVEKLLMGREDDVRREAMFLFSLAELCLMPGSPAGRNGTKEKEDLLTMATGASCQLSGSFKKRLVEGPPLPRLITYSDVIESLAMKTTEDCDTTEIVASTDTDDSRDPLKESQIVRCPSADDLQVSDYLFPKLHTFTSTPLRRKKSQKSNLNNDKSSPSTPFVECSDNEFAEILRQRDPTGVGLPDPLGRDFLRGLLSFYAQDRMTVDEALNNRWFETEIVGYGV